jgi:hypothetical protein
VFSHGGAHYFTVRIELDDVAGDRNAFSAEYLDDALIRFRLFLSRRPSPYHQAIIEGADSATILPDAPTAPPSIST